MAHLQEHFDELLDDPIAELKQLQETDGIVEFHGRFELIRTRVHLSEEYLVSAYLAGLRMDTQMHILMFQPQSIRQCLLLGRLYEKPHPNKPFNTGWSNSKPNISSKGIFPYKNNGDIKVGYPVNNDKPEEAQLYPKQFLYNEEMSKRRAQGLCYFCNEKYTPCHYLKHKKTQLFMIETEEEDDEEMREEQLVTEEECDIA